MKTSVHWLNRYLDPGDLTPDLADEILTNASFPIDFRDDLTDGDACLEVEVTSNRGDCLSHVGLAREIAARTGRRLIVPQVPEFPRAGRIEQAMALQNTVPGLCPRFTVQVIRGVRVGPSPAWLVSALESVGQRSINNIVDVTNFINFELGHPCHAFDLARLSVPRRSVPSAHPNVPPHSVPSERGDTPSASHETRHTQSPATLIIRLARKGEPLTTLDGKARKLTGDEVVVADSDRAQSLAGIIGGADSEVSDATTDIVLEVATWDPVAVRRAARHHQVRTDASHRFERYVDPRTLDFAAARAAALMIEVAGGQLCDGMLDQGQPLQSRRTVDMRPGRCRALLGIHISDEAMLERLAGLEIQTSLRSAPDGQLLFRCTIPAFRPDLLREVDLIEEIARLHGFEHIPIHPRMNVEVKHPQESERAVRELTRILTGMGFFETVTFSFVSREHASAFLPKGHAIIAVDDERRRHEPALRPSIIPGLLACRKANQDSAVEAPGGVRLFEIAHTFAGVPQHSARVPQHSVPSAHADDTTLGTESRPTLVEGIREERMLALVMDIPGIGKGKAGDVDQRQKGIRILRGILEAASTALAGAQIELEPAQPTSAAFDPAAFAHITFRGQRIGSLGLIAAHTQKMFDLDTPLAAAEVSLDPLTHRFPPRTPIRPLPSFPGIERDLSLIVGEEIPWEQVRKLVEAANLDRLEEAAFVGSYRGSQVGPGKKSLTLRLRFRDPSRTMRHEEVDPQIAALVELATRELAASLRA